MNARQSSLRLAAALVLFGSIASSRFEVAAAEPVVPPDIQAALTVRMLQYDRGLKGWAADGLRVGVVSKGGLDAYAKGLDGRDVQGLKLATVQTRPQDEPALVAWIKKERVRLLYVAADTGDEAAAAVAAAASEKIPSLTATRSQFDTGADLAIVVRDGKPHILVRLAGAKAAGMDLDPKLLRLAEVIR